MYSHADLVNLSTIYDDIQQQDNAKFGYKQVPQNDDPKYDITYVELLRLKTDVD